jgi:fructose-bisphosphate aldolase class II
MTLATLSEVLQPALRDGYAVAGLVCLGWEDMRAYAMAAQAERAPVILQAGPSCRAHTPLPVLGKMLRHLAESVDVPVVAHLDHGYTFEECREALDSGFTSLMFDGSRKPLAQNIAETARIAEMAHAAGISCEGEIGFVGYSGGEASAGRTRRRPRALPARPAWTPWRSRSATCTCSRTRRRAGRAAHPRHRGGDRGAAGDPRRLRRAAGAARGAGRGSRICKFNIGTELGWPSARPCAMP